MAGAVEDFRKLDDLAACEAAQHADKTAAEAHRVRNIAEDEVLGREARILQARRAAVGRRRRWKMPACAQALQPDARRSR